MKGQNKNVPGILATFHLLVNPSLAVPHLTVPDIRHIPFKRLRETGLKAIVFDKDNTLTAPYVNEIHPPFQEAWKDCLRTFGRENVLIVSNSAGTPDDVDYKHAKIVEEALDVPVLRHAEKKPAGGGELKAYFKKYCQPHEVAVVGDRLLTDIVYGNRVGAFTIFTKDIVTEKNDNWWAVRVVEESGETFA
ncbi:hypothetical protein HDV05_004822 [Chytridiales sp. JEL 0842]|nr:hypothetical protein HDV05_004822 [Chytridiales sp. JEL 0842]